MTYVLRYAYTSKMGGYVPAEGPACFMHKNSRARMQRGISHPTIHWLLTDDVSDAYTWKTREAAEAMLARVSYPELSDPNGIHSSFVLEEVPA
jgi:hypothetical protein